LQRFLRKLNLHLCSESTIIVIKQILLHRLDLNLRWNFKFYIFTVYCNRSLLQLSQILNNLIKKKYYAGSRNRTRHPDSKLLLYGLKLCNRY
jgi:hypothetical protein